MKSHSNSTTSRISNSHGCSGRNRLAVMALLLAAALLPTALRANVAAEPASTKPTRVEATLAGNAKCLKCHSRKLNKSLEDGTQLSLYVAQAELSNSAHSEIVCTSCHSAIAGKKHPAKESISNARAFSLEQNENCRGCHASKFTQYEGSIHARLLAEGNLQAPMCTDCHSAHAVQSMAVYQPQTGLPCKKCHTDIYDAYAQSVHGKARADGNVIRPDHIQAPICADCHQAHEVNAVASGEQLRATCLNCHDDAKLAHAAWLPNSELHLSVVSCPACHSPLAERRIDLELYDPLAEILVGQDDSYDGMAERMHSAEQSADGLDALGLWQVVRESSREGQAVDVTLRGRMKVSSGVEAHQLAIKGAAVRNCDSCHKQGSEPFQNVTVSITNPDGRKHYYEADRKVLNSVVSVDSIGGFYALGGTRIRLLDGLAILGLIGGLAVPIGHLTIGRMLKKKR
jgi:hypothetical protein